MDLPLPHSTDCEHLLCAIETSFRQLERKESVPAILTLTEKHVDKCKYLCCSVADGKNIVVQAMFSEEDVGKNLRVALPSDPKGALAFIQSFIDPNSKGRSDQKNFTLTQISKESLKLECLERMPSGLVRHAWTGELHATKGAMTDEPITLTFMLRRLIRSTDQTMSQYRESLTRVDALTQGLNEWKDTALKISGVWNNEKTKLLENFLKLYNMRKDYIKALEQQVDELKKTIEEMQSMPEQHVGATVSGSKLPSFLLEQPEDQDEEMYDPETVALLAAGPIAKVRRAKAEPQPKRKRAKRESMEERKVRDAEAEVPLDQGKSVAERGSHRRDTATMESKKAASTSLDDSTKTELPSEPAGEISQSSRMRFEVLRKQELSETSGKIQHEGQSSVAVTSSDHNNQRAKTKAAVRTESSNLGVAQGSHQVASSHAEEKPLHGNSTSSRTQGRKPKILLYNDSDSDDSFLNKLTRSRKTEVHPTDTNMSKRTESTRDVEPEGPSHGYVNEECFIDGGMRDDILAQLEALNDSSNDKT